VRATTFNHVSIHGKPRGRLARRHDAGQVRRDRPQEARRPRPVLLAGVLALVLALSQATPAPATLVSASGSDQGAGKNCVSAEEASARAAGDSGGDEDAPPKFSPAFYKRVFTLDVSLDGVEGRELPVSIEEVCDIPKARAKEAAQLAGADGVALLLPRTSVWQGPTRLSGTAAELALEGADTANLRVRLARPRAWRQDEDGSPVATFRAGRIEVTD
jgi:hypothetical protein